MPVSSERSLSVWKSDTELVQFPPLAGAASAEVCVIGAGIAGMSVAYHLARAGKRVVVLDDNAVGGGETAQTTAHLMSAFDDRYYKVESMHGLDASKLVFQSHQGAIERIAGIVDDEQIACDLVRLDGYLVLAPGSSEDELRKELEAAHRAGYREVEWVERVPGLAAGGGPALRFPNQGQFHPLKYLAGLARCVRRDGGTIHTGNHVTRIEEGTPLKVGGDGFEVSADVVVVATNSPVSELFRIHTKQAPYRTFAIAARVRGGSVPPLLYWDTLEHYHYVRLQHAAEGAADDLLIVGGEDHKTGHEDDADQRFARLEEWARERFPIGEVVLRWSGQYLDPVDYLAFIGRDPGYKENVYLATGDSGQGMTHGTIAGILISDLILGRPNEWEKLYAPSRKTLSFETAKHYLEENLDVAVQYKDLLPTGGEVSDADQIAAGSGAVLQRGTSKIAAYRDEQGVLHQCSAYCTHLGCVVQWNGEEQSWDCPCHGSRFSPTGDEVLNGPALTGLKPLEGAAG